MSCSKRPFDGQDPDYEDSIPNEAKRLCLLEEHARTEMCERVTSVIEREFGTELLAREKEVMEIQERLHQAQKALHMLRYVAVSSFYEKKQVVPEETQKRIHPAVKKLIGKEPRNWTPLERRPSKYRSVTSDKKKEPSGGPDAVSKMPRYIPPKLSDNVVPEKLSRGLHHKTKTRIVIGNISKWVPPDMREDAASHKWMMYVRGPKEAPDISSFVSKVRFFLHPSYQPHDVVEVTSSPFHLSRRGWGEFPVRVQIHFCNPSNRPVDLIHQLKLDRTCTGLQTLGAETLVDLWLNPGTETAVLDHDKEADETEAVAKEKCDDVLYEIVPKLEPLDSEEELLPRSEDHVKQEDDMVKSKVDVTPLSLDHDYFGSTMFKQDCDVRNTESHSVAGAEDASARVSSVVDTSILPPSVPIAQDIAVPNAQDSITNTYSTGVSNLADRVAKAHNVDRTVVPKRDPCGIQNAVANSGMIQNHERTASAKFKTLVKCMDKSGRVFYLMLGKSKSESPAKVGNPVSILRTKTKPESCSLVNACKSQPSDSVEQPALVMKDGQLFLLRKQREVLSAAKTGFSLLKKQTHTKPVDEEDTRLLLSGRTLVVNKANSKLVMSPNKVHYKDSVSMAVQMCNFTDVALAVRWLLRHMPVVSPSAKDPEFRVLHPYCAPDEASFLRWNIGKQRAAEWLRAKAVQRVLQDRFSEQQVWSTRAVAVWAKLHGYTPALPPTTRTAECTESSHLVPDTYSEPAGVTDWLEKNVIVESGSQDEELDVDVVCVDPQHTGVRVKQEPQSDDTAHATVEVHRLDPQMEEQCLFVRDLVRKLGIKLSPVELLPGVVSCVAERVLLEAMRSLVDDLVRRSLCAAWRRNGNRCPDSIVIDDVRKAILHRPEFDLFSNSGLGVEVAGSDTSGLV